MIPYSFHTVFISASQLCHMHYRLRVNDRPIRYENISHSNEPDIYSVPISCKQGLKATLGLKNTVLNCLYSTAKPRFCAKKSKNSCRIPKVLFHL